MLQDEIVQTVAVADLKGSDDVGVLELERQFCLAAEARQQGRILGPRRRQHLDRHCLPEFVPRLVDAGHATLAESVENLVAVEKEAVGVAAR